MSPPATWGGRSGLPLPAGVQADTLSATYADGILEVSALVGEPGPTAKIISGTVGEAKES
jgi:hypothetical protein